MQLPTLSSLHANEGTLASVTDHNFSFSMSSSQTSPVASKLILPDSSSIPLVSAFHQIEKLSGHLHPIHVIHFMNDTRIVVKTSPPPWTPLLRHEGAQLSAEAAALALLAKSSLPVPELVRYEPLDSHGGPSFLLTVHLSGISYAAVRPDLNGSERAGIERQISSMRDVILQHKSPTFGPANEVAGGQGFDTWEEAFNAMIEDVLMDGEDMLVALPFTDIRHLVRRMGWQLREVQEARLVVRGLGQAQNVIVDRQTNTVTGLVDLGSTFWGDGEWAERKGERGVL